MPETIEELRQRRDLLKEIAELGEKLAEQDYNMEAISKHLETLNEIASFKGPTEDEMEDAESHLLVLRALEDLKGPTEDEMEDAAEHLTTLRAIEDAA
jgi:hypothetical protein